MMDASGRLENSLYRQWLASDDYFDALAVLSTGVLHPGRGMANDLLAEMLDWRGVRVLDVGAGTGWSHRYFSHLGAEYHSVEPNAYMRRTAVSAGVPELEITAAAAEELDGRWQARNGPFDRLMVQGVIGFLDDGLRSLQPLVQSGDIREIVFVDWVGDIENAAGAPVKATYNLAEIVGFCEALGFGYLDVQTFAYQDVRTQIAEETLFERVCAQFVEAQEIDQRDEVGAKFRQFLHHEGLAAKRYVVLVARREGCDAV